MQSLNVNAKQLVNGPGYGRVDKPWRYELRWAITEHYLGKMIHIDAGHALSLQYHVEKDEAIFVLDGCLDLHLDDETRTIQRHRLEPGMSARVIPGRRHRFEAVTDVDLVEVSSPQIDDVVRLQDRYGRQGTTAAQRGGAKPTRAPRAQSATGRSARCSTRPDRALRRRRCCQRPSAAAAPGRWQDADITALDTTLSPRPR